MDLLDRVGKKGGNKNSPDRMGLFQPQCRKAKTLLLAWLLASLRSSRSAYIVRFGSEEEVIPSRAEVPLVPKADVATTCANVRLVPKSDMA
jgi:hypothetical protein